jgi:catechol 2,3-dioxygenase-like lactoylglutathione lyase family enzyme
MADSPRIDGLLEASIYVDDIERSVRFYQALLGFEIIFSGGRLWALQTGTRQLLLVCQRQASAQLPTGSHSAEGEQHLAFAIAVADLEVWEHRLAQQGVTLEEKRQWPRGGTSLYFRDPDRHLIELATPGVWEIY